MIGHVVAVLLSLWNWHRYDVPDPASVVLPVGLIISLAVVLLLLHTGWQGWEMIYRDRVAMYDKGA